MEEPTQVATALHLTVKALQFYTPEHPRVVEALVNLEQSCAALLSQRPRFTFTVSKGALLFEGQPFVNPHAHVKALAATLESRHLGGLIFLAGVTRRELIELVRLLALRPDQIKAAGGPDEILSKAEVRHLKVSHVRYEAVTEQEEVVWSKSVLRIDPNDPNGLPSLLQKSLADGKGVDTAEIRALLDHMANDDEQLTLLRERLVAMGINREQFDELLNVVSFDKLPVEQRIEKLLAGDALFNFPANKLQHFVRELIEGGRAQELHRLLERYVTGLTRDSYVVRHSVSDGLSQIVTFHLPRETEQIVGTAILNHFVKENDARVRAVATEAAANFVSALVSSGRSEPALRVVERLDVAAPAATADLARALGESQRAEGVITQVRTADPETLTRVVLPLVVRLGGAIAHPVIEALGNEEDRNRRGRLVKALKSIGEPAFPALVETLRSSVWFVVRNTLNVLGDVGTPAQVEAIGRTLRHSDPRVRRAAARALGKIGGTEAERLLVEAMSDRDQETQAEVLLCLGSMKATTAIPGLAELARAKLLGTDDKVRELALTTLGQIGSDEAVPVLAEIVRPKGFFVRDTPTIRVAAAKALAAIKTPAATDVLRNAANGETDRATKAVLQKLI
jgi:hypothetical protein